jgi:alanine-glyoxylate transaminase/serine-glyoxylate transaminase/serine-pyruvate transaminase
MEMPWGQAFDEAEAAEFIRKEKPQVVGFVQAETSTGVYQTSKQICVAAHEVGALVIADCVTSLGTMPVELDANGIDVAYSCTQKGLSCPPGLWLKARKTTSADWYLDLKLLAEYCEGAHRYHHTAPISLFYALREGLENRWRGTSEAMRRLWQGSRRWGFDARDCRTQTAEFEHAPRAGRHR